MTNEEIRAKVEETHYGPLYMYLADWEDTRPAMDVVENLVRSLVAQAYEEAAQMAENEWAHTSGYGTPDFLAYQKACGRVAKAIRALKDSLKPAPLTAPAP